MSSRISKDRFDFKNYDQVKPPVEGQKKGIQKHNSFISKIAVRLMGKGFELTIDGEKHYLNKQSAVKFIVRHIEKFEPYIDWHEGTDASNHVNEKNVEQIFSRFLEDAEKEHSSGHPLADPATSVSGGSLNTPPNLAKSRVGVNVAQVLSSYIPVSLIKSQSERAAVQAKIHNEEMHLEVDDQVVAEKLNNNRQLAEEQNIEPPQYKQSKHRLGKDILSREGNQLAQSTFTIQTPYRKEKGENDTQGTATTLLNGAVGEAESVGRRGVDGEPTEDRHIAVEFNMDGKKMLLTGVFDGHGGYNAAQFTQDRILECIHYRLTEFKGRAAELSDLAIYNALKIALVDVGQLYQTEHPKAGDGTTATIALQIGDDVWVANLGDSRTMLLDADGKITQLSEDMEAVERFTKGVAKRHGKMENNRVVAENKGTLGVLRTIGDVKFPGISARCKIVKIKKPAQGYLIHHCDGISEVLKKDEIGRCVQTRLEKGDSLAQAARALVEYSFKLGSGDNLSVQIVDLSKF